MIVLGRIKFFGALFLFLITGFSLLHADPNGFGIGLIVGEPTGISAKYYLSQSKAVDAGAGWSVIKKFIRFHGDFLFHNRKFFEEQLDLPLVLYYGFGVKTILSDDFGLGLRIPLGVLHDIKKTNIDLFLEIVPGMDVLPETKFGFDAALGARYYFISK